MRKSLFMVVLVVLVAGCTGQQPVNTDANNGLVITEFSANPKSVFTGESVLFDVTVENVGGTTAKNAQVDLFRVENYWRDEFGNEVTDTRTKDIGTLRPPEPLLNIAGQSRVLQYTLMTPPISQGLSSKLPVEVRVTYDYNTSGLIDIPIVSRTTKRIMETNKETISPPTIINSAGPIKMTMDTKFSPFIFDTERNEDTQEFPLSIIFSNVGSGFPITPEDSGRARGAGGKLTGTIRLLGPGAEFSDCLGVTSGTTINLDSADIVLRLREGSGSVPLGCMISIDKDAWNNRPKDSVKLIFELFYRYFADSTVEVQVTGR